MIFFICLYAMFSYCFLIGLSDRNSWTFIDIVLLILAPIITPILLADLLAYKTKIHLLKKYDK